MGTLGTAIGRMLGGLVFAWFRNRRDGRRQTADVLHGVTPAKVDAERRERVAQAYRAPQAQVRVYVPPQPRLRERGGGERQL